MAATYPIANESDSDPKFFTQIVNRELRAGDALEARLTSLTNALMDAFQDEIPKFKARYPAAFRDHMLGDPAVNILIGTVSLARVPIAAGLTFGFAEPDGNLHISSRRFRCPGNCRTAEPSIAKAGWTAEIDRYLASHQLNGSLDEARGLVQLEIDAHPAEVGGPTDLVTLKPRGIEWTQRKPDCTGMVSDPPQR